MCRIATKNRRKLIGRAAMLALVTLLLFGAAGCGRIGRGVPGQVDEIVSFYTSSYGMSRTPVYAFALYKEEGGWFFSATCYIAGETNHFTSFGSFPIPAGDAEGVLAVLREEGEIARLARYRKPFLTRLLRIDDAPSHCSGMTFADSSRLERDTRVSASVLDSLYDLAEKHYREAESVEVHAVSVRRESPDPGLSCSFTLETDGYDWFLSFSAALECAGGRTEAEDVRIGAPDAEEVFRIIQEQQLVAKVKQYETSADEEPTACGETAYQISFRFADGSSGSAPIDAGTELTGAFYSLARAAVCPE